MSVPRPPEPTPPAPTTPIAPLDWKRAQAIVTGLAGLAGLGVYVYLLGGIVAWLRVVAARLPADNVTAAFEDRSLVTAGIKVLVFEALLLCFVSAAIAGVLEIVKRAERMARRPTTGTRRRFNRPAADDADDRLFVLTIVFRALLVGLLLAALGGSTGALTPTSWLGIAVLLATLFAAAELTFRWTTGLFAPFAERPPSGRRFAAECAARLARWTLVAEAVGLAFWKLAAPLGSTVIVLLLLLVLTRYARAVRLRTSQRAFMAGAVVVVATALNMIIIPYLATPPVAFERATVTMAKGGTIQGAYLGRSSDGLYLATCEPTRTDPQRSELARVMVIADPEIKELTLGGPRYVFDVGHRPTLFGLGVHFLSGSNLSPGDDGVQLDPRERRDVCTGGAVR
jgi:hypothetical protein